MIRTSHSTLGMAGMVISVVLTLGIGASSASADSPASIAKADDRARTSLSDFAKSWMNKMKNTEAQNKERPSVRPGAERSVVTYRGFGDDYKVELRPTGHPTAPFIGVLRYTEQVYTCRESGSAKCSVAASVPVTEIFRYQGGRWVY